MPTESYDDFLVEELRDVEVAADYLSAALKGGDIAELLMALGYVAKAHDRITIMAKVSDPKREPS